MASSAEHRFDMIMRMISEGKTDLEIRRAVLDYPIPRGFEPGIMGVLTINNRMTKDDLRGYRRVYKHYGRCQLPPDSGAALRGMVD